LYISSTLLSIYILLIYSFLEIYGRPAIIDSRIFSKHVQRPDPLKCTCIIA